MDDDTTMRRSVMLINKRSMDNVWEEIRACEEIARMYYEQTFGVVTEADIHAGIDNPDANPNTENE